MQSRELVKLYYRIGEVSEIVGVQPHVLRYWETEFRSIRPQKSSKGQRVYSRRDVEKLLRVKDLLRNQGFTIAGARKRLSDPADLVAVAATPAPVSPGVSSSATSAAGSPVALSAVPVPTLSVPAALVIAAPAAAAVEATARSTTHDAAGQALAQRAATERAVTERAVAERAVAQRGAKDMRKALLGLRLDLLRMLGDIDATRTRERGGH